MLKGRTTYAMSGEVPAAKRIPFAKLQPADVLFFGERARSRSPPRSTTWASTSATAGSSTRRATASRVAQLTGWYARRFAWARRPLAEAGLVSAA